MSSLASPSELRQQMDKKHKQVENILDSRMESLFNNVVIPEMKRVAAAMLLPDKFIEGISFVKKGRNAGSVINTFGGADLPLAAWFNYGTKRNYKIEPKVKHPAGAKRAERDKEDIGGGSVSHPTVLHWKGSGGKDFFAKSVIHPGFPKTLAMEFGLGQGITMLKNKIPEIIKEEEKRFEK